MAEITTMDCGNAASDTMESIGMEAGTRTRFPVFLAAIFVASLICADADAADYRTRNFIIQAPSQQLAQAVGKAAEKYRTDLANYWLGKELPSWPHPCPIRVIAGPRVAAQGVTTYNLSPVRDFQMQVEGSPQRILDSVLPHEITHTILATHFGRPLPRWADEGICTTVEHVSERNKHEAKLREFLSTRRGIAMNQLFLLTEYPSDVLPMYAQGYSVCRFLIDQKGPQTFIRFLHDYMSERSWTANVRKHYGYDSLAELQEYWLAWVGSGSGSTERFAKVDPRRTRVVQASGASANTNDTRIALASPTKSQAGSFANSNRDSGQRRNQLASAARSMTSPNEEGWYSRLKNGTGKSNRNSASVGRTTGELAKSSPAAGTAQEAIVPPSVRNSGRYSVSQPRPEEQISRGGSPAYETIDMRTIRRFR